MFEVGDSEGLEGRKKVRNKGREGREEANYAEFRMRKGLNRIEKKVIVE